MAHQFGRSKIDVPLHNIERDVGLSCYSSQHGGLGRPGGSLQKNVFPRLHGSEYRFDFDFSADYPFTNFLIDGEHFRVLTGFYGTYITTFSRRILSFLHALSH